MGLKKIKAPGCQVVLINSKMSKNKQNDHFNFGQLTYCLSFKEIS